MESNWLRCQRIQRGSEESWEQFLFCLLCWDKIYIYCLGFTTTWYWIPAADFRVGFSMRTRNVVAIKAKHRHFWVLWAVQKEKEPWRGIFVDHHCSSNLRKKKGSWPNYGPHCNWLSMTRFEIDYLFDNILYQPISRGPIGRLDTLCTLTSGETERYLEGLVTSSSPNFAPKNKSS